MVIGGSNGEDENQSHERESTRRCVWYEGRKRKGGGRLRHPIMLNLHSTYIYLYLSHVSCGPTFVPTSGAISLYLVSKLTHLSLSLFFFSNLTPILHIYPNKQFQAPLFLSPFSSHFSPASAIILIQSNHTLAWDCLFYHPKNKSNERRIRRPTTTS